MLLNACISDLSCRDLCRKLRCSLIEQIALLFHSLEERVLSIDALQTPGKMLTSIDKSVDGCLLDVFAAVFA